MSISGSQFLALLAGNGQQEMIRESQGWKCRPVIQATWEAEIKDCKFNVRLQSKFKQSLADIVRPYLKMKSKKRTGDLAQWTGHLPSLYKAPDSIPTTAREWGAAGHCEKGRKASSTGSQCMQN